MMSCKELARSVSESLDHKLPVSRRISSWVHLALCGMCRNYVGQMKLLRRAIKLHLRDEGEQSIREKLPEDVRERIRNRLKD